METTYEVPDRPNGVNIQLRIPKELLADVQEEADKHFLSVHDMFVTLIERGLRDSQPQLVRSLY